MPGRDEISSTEKLLDLIRNKSDEDFEFIVDSPAGPSPRGLGSFFKRLFPFGRTLTLGVDIGYSDLKLAKMGQSSDRRPELVDYLTVPFDSGISRDSPTFPHFLHSALTGFCGSPRRMNIWSIISGAKVDIRYLRIPKLSKKEIPNAVYWSFKKESPFEENDFIIDFEILGDVVEEGLEKIGVLAYIAPQEEIGDLKAIFAKADLPLTGVLTVPFAFQNLFRTNWIETNSKNVCNLYVGRNWSRIDLFGNGNLVISRDIKTGMNSMIEAIREGIYDKKEQTSMALADLEGGEMAETVIMGPTLEEGKARKLFFSIIDGAAPLIDVGSGLKFKEDEIFAMFIPALDRLVRQLERTFEHYSNTFPGERIVKIYPTGRVSGYKPLVDYVSEQLHVSVETIDPFGPDETLLAGVPPPESESEREAYAPAIGLALSDNSRSPNLIFTYNERQERERVRLTNYIISGAALFIIIVLTLFSFGQGHQIKQKKAQTVRLEGQLTQMGKIIKETELYQLVALIQANKKTLAEYGRRYMAMAVISELSDMTPSEIRLVDVTADLPQTRARKKPAPPGKASEETARKTLTMEGFIFGDRLTLEPTLAEYLVKLEHSSLFGQPFLEKKIMEKREGKDVLHFYARMELI